MELGFETIGNATLIVHDHKPVLVTDPWTKGSAYFGSWTRAHEIPAEQMEAIENCDYIWLSHGHPDHLSIPSLNPMKDKKILLADHAGGRIANDMRGLGFDVQVMEDRVWTNLSPNVNAVSVPDYNQDSLLLVDVGGALLVNLNDMTPRGWGPFVQKAVRDHKRSFLLQGFCYDADMINFFDEDGTRIDPLTSNRVPLGQAINRVTNILGVTHVIPFSSLHKFQREDSAWARVYNAKLDDYKEGFDAARCELLPAYVQYDCLTDEVELINPPATPDILLPPKDFRDDWAEPLEEKDVAIVTKYFQEIEHLGNAMDFVNVRVGGVDNIVELQPGGFQKGVMFEVPRHSLMRTMRYEIFDDLLIGNFMKTSLIGKWPNSGLYPDFTPYVGKYSDNGRAKTTDEVREYFREYRRRAPLDYMRHRIQYKSAQAVISRIDADSEVYRLAQKSWWFIKRHFGA